ncbi:hypothetical protein D9756_009301 [Leucocoprinus leucothites]|uniref:Uncharacterized protein n=1 Tax=Leucocoprinus leucothites TaxID=201217 RepID=A0A8H5CXM9_9AGAR|nr:hypothetical protein D9756_009301 [Leucoagaricus leucothites]
MAFFMSRQQLRRYRLLELEREQHLEDAEGLVMTEEQRQSLLGSFMSAKIEFHDLDGLRWTRTALRRRQHTRRPTVLPNASPDCSFFLLTSRHAPTYDLDATVRASKCDYNRPVITKHSFWDQKSNMNTLALGLPLPPVNRPSSPTKGPNFTFNGGLGLVNPVAGQKHGCHKSQLNSVDFYYNAAAYSRPSLDHSSQWTPQAC